MSIRSITPRRSASRTASTTHQMLVFQLRQEWFALPLNAAQKVIWMGELYGASRETGISLTLYQEKELLVIDLEQRIFGQMDQHLLSGTTDGTQSVVPSTTRQNYLLIVPNLQGGIVGLAIRQQPALRRVLQTAFAPIPPIYIAEGKLRCVNAIIIQKPEQPPLFLLNLEQLLQSHLALPPGG